MSKFWVALVFVALNFYTYYQFRSDEVIPARESFSTFPLEIDDWRCNAAEVISDEVIDNLGVTDYLLCTFVNESAGAWINLYAGYHESQHRTTGGRESMIHPPEHCLPGSGWDIIDSRLVQVDFGVPGEAKRFTIAQGNERNVVYFWYQSRGRVFARNYERLFYMFLDRTFESRTDGALIRFTVPVAHGDEEAADATFRDLAEKIAPELGRFVPD